MTYSDKERADDDVRDTDACRRPIAFRYLSVLQNTDTQIQNVLLLFLLFHVRWL